MMATIKLPCSKLRSLNTSLLHVGGRKPCCVTASATATRTDTSYQAKNGFQLSIDTTFKPMFQELPPLPKKLETLFDKQEMEKEAGVIVQRLKIAVERLAEIEMNKFMDRVKAEKLSKEDSILVEEMRKEIVRQYLEKPMRYLKGECRVSFEQKIRDVSVLVSMVEGLSLA